jgi:cytochrome P450
MVYSAKRAGFPWSATANRPSVVRRSAALTVLAAAPTFAPVTVPDIDLADSATFAHSIPHARFAELRRRGVVWQTEPLGGPGYWAVTRYHDCVAVNRDFERFSSARQSVFIWDFAPEDLAQQQLMMLNMDPPLHTRYRGWSTKGSRPACSLASRNGSTRRPTRSSTG